jgi:hypothetical protein
MTPTNDHVDPAPQAFTRERFMRVAIQPSFAVARGEVVSTVWGVKMHPSDHMVLRNNGRTPLWTRHMLGVREAERDRRHRRV